MEKSMTGILTEEPRQEVGGGGCESCIVEHCGAGVGLCLHLEFGEAEGDRILDLPGQVKVVSCDMRKERVDKMQTTQIVGRSGSHGGVRQADLWGPASRRRRRVPPRGSDQSADSGGPPA